jgi:hypothetical protein
MWLPSTSGIKGGSRAEGPLLVDSSSRKAAWLLQWCSQTLAGAERRAAINFLAFLSVPRKVHQLHLQTKGGPMPDKRDAVICFTTTQAMRDALDELAADREVGRSSLIRELIRTSSAYQDKIADEDTKA